MICLSSAGSLTSLHDGMWYRVGGRKENKLVTPSAPGPRRNQRCKRLKTNSTLAATHHSKERSAAHAALGSARHLSRLQASEDTEATTIRNAGEPRPRGLVAPLEEMYFQPEAESAICVQSFDDSLNSAIRTTYRISLRSSSLFMPRYPSTKVVIFGVSRVHAEKL